MRGFKGPAGEFFGARKAPDFDDDDDDDRDDYNRKDDDDALDAFERELLADNGNVAEEDEEEEEKNRKLFMQMFEEESQKKQNSTTPSQKANAIQKGLERLRKTVKAEGLVPWTFIGPATVRATTTRIETLVTELHASLNRMQRPGDASCAAFWYGAARPPWKPAIHQKALSLQLLGQIVEARYAAFPFSLVILYQNAMPSKNRVALLADWQNEEVNVLLAVILEGACPESVALGPPDSMHALNALPVESQKTLLWYYVGTTLADMRLMQGVSSTEKKDEENGKKKKK